ncbi:MAG: hypothetical protein AB7E32_16865 [Desulfovibrio sp.]
MGHEETREIDEIVMDVKKCAYSWAREARLLGNVTAGEVRLLAEEFERRSSGKKAFKTLWQDTKRTLAAQEQINFELQDENAELRAELWGLQDLISRANAELEANTHKGHWEEWNPAPEDLVAEIHHHADKLLAACDAGDPDEMAEHLADLFNYVRKGWEGVMECRDEEGGESHYPDATEMTGGGE